MTFKKLIGVMMNDHRNKSTNNKYILVIVIIIITKNDNKNSVCYYNWHNYNIIL